MKLMSSVRGCDNCGFIFFENATGWSNGTMNKFVEDPKTGEKKMKQISVDYCPTCVSGMEGGIGNTEQPATVVESRKTRQLPASRPNHNQD
jgi:hypothetical protein